MCDKKKEGVDLTLTNTGNTFWKTLAASTSPDGVLLTAMGGIAEIQEPWLITIFSFLRYLFFKLFRRIMFYKSLRGYSVTYRTPKLRNKMPPFYRMLTWCAPLVYDIMKSLRICGCLKKRKIVRYALVRPRDAYIGLAQRITADHAADRFLFAWTDTFKEQRKPAFASNWLSKLDLTALKAKLSKKAEVMLDVTSFMRRSAHINSVTLLCMLKSTLHIDSNS